jgi:hypothetical protein
MSLIIHRFHAQAVIQSVSAAIAAEAEVAALKAGLGIGDETGRLRIDPGAAAGRGHPVDPRQFTVKR